MNDAEFGPEQVDAEDPIRYPVSIARMRTLLWDTATQVMTSLDMETSHMHPMAGYALERILAAFDEIEAAGVADAVTFENLLTSQEPFFAAQDKIFGSDYGIVSYQSVGDSIVGAFEDVIVTQSNLNLWPPTA